jgi:hypothetical protein
MCFCWRSTRASHTANPPATHHPQPATAVAAQNSALTAKPGAFTGELPAPLLKDFGLDWVIIGRCGVCDGWGDGRWGSRLVVG